MSPRRHALAVAGLVSAALAVPAGASAATTLQPGAKILTSAGSCTLNFEYTDGTSTYLGTAAHCANKTLEVVTDAAKVPFGKVWLRGNPNDPAADYAFIKVDPGALSRVSPAVKGAPQYPTGVSTAAQTNALDILRFSGFGIGFDLTALTQERRIGTLVTDNAETYQAIAPVLFGDSGGPVIQARTGKALGIVSRLCIGVCTTEGPTVEGVLAKAAARGLKLTLVTSSAPATPTPTQKLKGLLKRL